MSKKPAITVTVTGAAGQIGYSLLPMIASGRVFGDDQPVKLMLLDIPVAEKSLGGSLMELEDGYFPLLESAKGFTGDAAEAFVGCDYAILLGAFPRKQGMERKDLMEKNVAIFRDMGQALQKSASPDTKVLIVGNPANTNCRMCAEYAPKIPKQNFFAMTRLDHNRVIGQVALKAGVSHADVRNVIIWGNHSSTQFPDVSNGTVQGKPIEQVLGADTFKGDFIKMIQTRGAAVIAARGASSALSAARAAADHVKSLFQGTAPGEFVSMGVWSEGGKYGITDGLYYSVPCRCLGNGKYEVVGDLPMNDFSKQMMKTTETELLEEREEALQVLAAAGSKM